MSAFRIDNPSLQEMLQQVETGRIQLPEFQRDWRWNDEHIRNLIASVSQSFPIGVIMTLKIGDAGMLFKARPIEGTESSLGKQDPESLILDGQQRLTALFQSLMTEEPVKTSNTLAGTGLYYYLHMNKCVEGKTDYEDTILAFKDVLPQETSYHKGMFPLHKIFDSVGWRREYTDFWRKEENSTELDDKRDLWDEFEEKIIDVFKGYQIPVIELNDETPMEAICLIFERVNQQGIELNVFELLTAALASEKFSLRDDWVLRQKEFRRYKVLGKLADVNFLQSLTLIVTNNNDSPISCKRKDILELDRKSYENWSGEVEKGFIKAARFLHRQKIFDARDVPYSSQLIPLAAILSHLGDLGETDVIQRKIARWFWCGVLGEMYAGSTDTRAANDFYEVINWITDEGNVPTTIQNANFIDNRLVQLQSRNGAVFKGIYALIMHDRGTTKCCDFRSGIPIDEKIFFDDSIDIHHIFPKKWCENENIDKNKYNYDSIINKTPLSSNVNRMIADKAPSIYLPLLQNSANIDISKMDEILNSHLIRGNYLRVDDFEAFFDTRKEALLKAIENAMGKPVIRENEDRPDSSD